MHSNFFAQKLKKNAILFRYLRNYDYFCHDIRNKNANYLILNSKNNYKETN